MRQLSTILGILKSAGYIDANLSGVIDRIKFFPLGDLLLKRIQNEFCVDRDVNVPHGFISHNKDPVDLSTHLRDPLSIYTTANFLNNIQDIKKVHQNSNPRKLLEGYNFTNSNIKTSDKFLVNLCEGTLISSYYFINESAATEYFYKVQRERKIWWMRLSLNPGRYFFSEFSTRELKGCKIQSTRIKSQFNFGELELENIDVVPLRVLDPSFLKNFFVDDSKSRRPVLPAMVRSTVCWETAVLGILMDSIEDSRDEKICLNRKIAPYQCGIFYYSKDEKLLLELADLAAHLTNVAGKAGLDVLNLQHCKTSSKDVLIRELKDMDRVGIPYSIILNDDSLRTGVMKLRSRDTNLSEVIHITDIPNYLQKIFGI